MNGCFEAETCPGSDEPLRDPFTVTEFGGGFEGDVCPGGHACRPQKGSRPIGMEGLAMFKTTDGRLFLCFDAPGRKAYFTPIGPLLCAVKPAPPREGGETVWVTTGCP